jgi:hypothetical protein
MVKAPNTTAHYSSFPSHLIFGASEVYNHHTAQPWSVHRKISVCNVSGS